MIDYLERLFSMEETAQDTSEGEQPLRRSLPEQEVEFRTAARQMQEELSQTAAVSWKAQEIQELQKLSRQLEWDAPKEIAMPEIQQTEPVFTTQETKPRFSEPAAKQVQDDLERRLRRSSRRYDSGFFSY